MLDPKYQQPYPKTNLYKLKKQQLLILSPKLKPGGQKHITLNKAELTAIPHTQEKKEKEKKRSAIFGGKNLWSK